MAPSEGAPAAGDEIANTSVSSQGGGRLDQVRQRGHVVCGTTKVVPGYGFLNADRDNDGFEVNLCRVVAVFNDSGAVKFRIIGAAAERGPPWRRARSTSWCG